MKTVDPAAGDLLYGVSAIAQHLGIKMRQAQYQIEKGALPHFRLGKVICARKSRLGEWLEASERAAMGEGANA